MKDKHVPPNELMAHARLMWSMKHARKLIGDASEIDGIGGAVSRMQGYALDNLEVTQGA